MQTLSEGCDADTERSQTRLITAALSGPAGGNGGRPNVEDRPHKVIGSAQRQPPGGD